MPQTIQVINIGRDCRETNGDDSQKGTDGTAKGQLRNRALPATPPLRAAYRSRACTQHLLPAVDSAFAYEHGALL